MANRHILDSDSLIASVKRRASIPDAQSMITNNEILEFANEEMALNLVPLIYSKHQDYYLVRETIPLVSGQIRYEIPYRAIGNKLREVAYQGTGSELREMHRMTIDDLTSQGYSADSSNSPSRFYIEGEEIVLNTQESSFTATGSLVVFYSLRPNVLVESANIATITGIDTATGVITFSGTPPTTFEANTEIDFIAKKSPNKIIKFDINVISVDAAAFNITVAASDIPSKLSVGDIAAIAGETNLVNSPTDLHPLLAQMVAARVLESLGDSAGLGAADKKLKKMEKNADLLLANRVTGSPVKAINRNGGLRSSGLGRRGRGGYTSD